MVSKVWPTDRQTLEPTDVRNANPMSRDEDVGGQKVNSLLVVYKWQFFPEMGAFIIKLKMCKSTYVSYMLYEMGYLFLY